MSLFVRSVFLLGLLTLSSTSNGFALEKTHVYIKNSLGVDLLIHCKSRDNDLGVQLLHPNDTFGFGFRVNLFGTTLFYCSFQWGNDFHWFDIFIANRDDYCVQNSAEW
ncbi:S-protein-like 2, partial [Mucuna pruriens]